VLCNTLCKRETEQGWTKLKIDYISGNGNKQNAWLCPNCARAYRKGQYCCICYQIWKDDDTICDGKDWVECNSCGRWVHIYCEIQYNSFVDLPSFLKNNN
jgi:hypothetical protein